jgi:transcriptional regulator with XRE-family HTH domain
VSGQDRSCQLCGLPLSRYNPGSLCQACTKASRKQQPDEPAELHIDGTKLAELRRKHGMTQHLLADRAGVSSSLVEKLEQNARRSASLATLNAVARVLNVPPDALLDGTPGTPDTTATAADSKQALIRAEPDVTTVQKWTGRETRALREALRMSGREFAARLGITERTVAKWERPGQIKTTLRPNSQAMLDTMLANAPQDARTRFETARIAARPDRAPEANGEITAAAQPAITQANDTRNSAPARTSPGDLAGGSPPSPESSVQNAGDDDGPVNRREFGISAMGLLASSVAAPAPGLADTARVDAEMAAGLGSIVFGYRQVYRSAGAASLLGPVRSTLGLLLELAPTAAAYRQPLVSLIGQAASLTGVILMLDGGKPAAARQYLTLAATAARQADDDELMAVTLGCRAFSAAYGGDTASGVEFAQEAARLAADSSAHPLTRGWTAAVASEMHATAGDEKACMQALDMAAAQLAEPAPDRPWKGIGAFSAAKLSAYRGGDLMRLHRYAESQAELRRALDHLDPVLAKHRCTAHIDLATAYIHGGEPDEGARHASSALSIIAVTGHADSLRRVTGLYQLVKPVQTPATREFRSHLLEVTAAS